MTATIAARIAEQQSIRAQASLIDSTAKMARVQNACDAKIAALQEAQREVDVSIDLLLMRPDVDLADEAKVVGVLMLSGLPAAFLDENLDEIIEATRARRHETALPEGVA